jgi:hypothetical protein
MSCIQKYGTRKKTWLLELLECYFCEQESRFNQTLPTSCIVSETVNPLLYNY